MAVLSLANLAPQLIAVLPKFGELPDLYSCIYMLLKADKSYDWRGKLTHFLDNLLLAHYVHGNNSY